MSSSCLVKPQCKYSSSDAKEKFCLLDNDEDGNDFDFQYVPVKEFKHIVRDVKRQRNQTKEEVIWTTYLRDQEQSKLISQQNSNDRSKCKSTRTLAESLEEVDRELMRLESDSLLETRFRTGTLSARDNEEKSQSARSLKKDSPLTKENGTSSTNLLLTIPEEENDHYYTGSSDSHKPHGAYARKSSSAQAFRNDRVQCRCYHYHSDLDYHSSPDIEPDRYSDDVDDDDDDNSIPVHPDPVVVSKILAIQRKVSIVLDSISYELDRIPLPDGEDDLLRRQQRIAEFSIRLSRNYLYDLSRQVSDIQRHIKAAAPDSRVRLSRRAVIMHMQAIEQKLISAHQLLLTALSAYWKHIPSSVMKNHPGKLKDILQVVMQLRNICLDIQLTSDVYCSGDDGDTFLGQEMENRCGVILSKFRPNSDNESLVPSHSAKSAATSSRALNKRRNRKTAANRFNMYAMDMRLAKAYLPKRAQSMLQLSRERRHNCQAAKHSSSILSKKSSVAAAARSSCEAFGAKTTKIQVPPKEDDIQTMIETVQPDLDAESIRSLKIGRRAEIYNELSYKNVDNHKSTKESQKLRKSSIVNKNGIKTNDGRGEDFSALLPVVENLLSLVKNNPNNTKTIPRNSIETIYDYLQLCQSKTKSPESHAHDVKGEIETGDKNMRLICCSTNQEDRKNVNPINFQSSEDFAKFNDASCQVNYRNSNPTFELLVSESARSCLNDYRKEYQHSLESNPMYTSTTQNKPWEIVSWIADKLVDELIVKLADDFQMEEVIQKLFDLEFQEL